MEPDRTNGQSAQPADGDLGDGGSGDVDVSTLTIVGVGASAGGLKAFSEFFAAMPPEPGMAFVLVQHLAPNHESELAELLQNHTPLRVVQVEDGVLAEPGGVYVIPPGKALSIQDGVLRLAEPDLPHGHRAPIDDFFRSLAADQGERAVCVVLSGTGSDGTLGLKTLKEAGGLTMAQDPDDAEYDGIPRSAVGTGFVDVVLPARKLGGRIVELRQQGLPLAPTAESLTEDDNETLAKIFSRLRAGTGHDFSRYKQTTVLRRIGRRMQVTGASDLGAYFRLLRKEPREVEALLKDLLISVTNFFRDPEAFAVLEHQAVPKLFERKGRADQVRVWVPGCATGEEAYSIAILLCEYASTLDDPPELQIFATDIDEAALQFARASVYPEVIAADVSPERLERFFVQDAGGYRVRESIRECVLFAEHNLLKDPPFSKLDLVSCRNLLIYLQRETQQSIFKLFAYALREPGFLFLGTSESVEGTKDLFSTVDKKRRLFQGRGVMRQGLRFPVMPPLSSRSVVKRRAAGKTEDDEAPASLDDLHQRLLIQHHAPPSVIVSQSHEILHIAGDVSRYLTFAPGRPTTDLLKVVRAGLRPELRTALFHAVEKKRTTDRIRTRIRIDGEPVYVILTVRPLRDTDGADGLVQIVFEEEPAAEEVPPPAEGEESPALEHLETELQRTRDRLQSTVEEYETSNEELKASNEELLSMNEELQNMTEEFETGREELQSVNEELSTVNQELKTKIEELGRANADLKNLIDSTDVATLFLDRDLRINRFTPRLGELFNVLPGDVGRPIAHLTQKVAYAAFLDDVRGVLDTLVPLEREVEADDGRRFLTRIVPYRTADDRIDGAVATFLDITRRVEAEEAARRREARFRRAIADAPIPVLLHAEDGEILQLSRALVEITGYTPEELPTLDAWLERAYPDDQAERVAADIDRLYETDGRVDEGEFRLRTAAGDERVWQFSSSPVGTDGQGRRLVVSMAADITERLRAEEALRAREAHLRLAVDALRLGTWDLDVRTGTAVRSPQHDAIFGYDEPLPEWTYEQFLSHVHPDDRASIDQSFEQAIASGTEWNFEGRIYRADGALRWIWARGVPHCDEEGEIARFVGAVLDITERKEAEAEHEAHAAQQAALAAFGLYALTETDVHALFDRAVAVVHDTLGTDFSKILELQPGGDALLLRTGFGWHEGLVGEATVPTDAGSQAGYTLSVDAPVVVDDMASETRFQGPELLTHHGVVSGMSVVIGGLDDPFGVFGTHTRTPRVFTSNDADFLQSVANAVASAIERIEATEHLEEQVERRTQTLRESENRLRLLYDVVSEPTLDISDQIQRALHLTTDLLGLDAGILSKVHDDTYTVVACYAPDSSLKPGQQFSVEDTPCAITLHARKPLTIDRLSASEYEGHPCRDVFAIESYAGAPVRTSDEVVGTLSFTGSKPRTPPFSASERDIVELLARWLGTALEREQAQDEVARSEQILAGVLLGSLEGIVALEAIRDDAGEIEDFRFLIVNPAAAAVYGRRAENLIGMPYLERMPSTKENGVFDTLVRVAETGKPYRDEIRYDEDGIEGWYDYTVVQLGDGVALTFRDITEQKEAEQAVRDSEARFRELFEGSPDAIFVESLDGVVLDVNPAACRLHNTTREWLVGRDLSDLVPPEYQEQAQKDFERLAAGEMGLLESQSYTADGLIVPVEVRTDRITYGGQEAVLLHVRDVTEREAAERALRESEERFAKAFRSAPVAMTITTLKENRYLDVNESYCALTGYTRDELLGRTSNELGITTEKAPHIPGFDQLGASGRVREVEFTIRTKSGDLRDVLVSAELIEISGLTCVLGIGFDMTDRRRLEREVIEAAEQERRRIGQDLHDGLGQQLTGAAFLSEVLGQRLAGDDRPEAEDARQITALINDVLAETRDLSRLLSPVDVFADGLVDALQDLADQTTRIFDVQCVLDTKGDVRVADNAVATHLYRIAQEAVNNAIKHAAPSTVRIELGQRPEGLRLRIADNGTGIATDAVELTSGLGLRTISYRATLIGGVLRIGRTASGSEVSILIPESERPPKKR